MHSGLDSELHFHLLTSPKLPHIKNIVFWLIWTLEFTSTRQNYQHNEYPTDVPLPCFANRHTIRRLQSVLILCVAS